MFDADNLVDRNFLLEMNDDLSNGSRVIQGYIDTKNPEDSWITAAYGVLTGTSTVCGSCLVIT